GALVRPGAHRHAVQRVRRVQGDHLRLERRRAGDRRGVQQRRRQHPRAARLDPLRAGAKKKVYILDEVHMLSSGAWNALLKTLEEPPPHAVFVFATTDPHKLPATILSRVQRYDFKLVPQRRIVEHLTKILDEEKLAQERSA